MIILIWYFREHIDLSKGQSTFKRLINPQSYHASIFQLGEELHDTFKLAHNAMYEIKLRTDDTSDYIDQALAYMFEVGLLIHTRAQKIFNK